MTNDFMLRTAARSNTGLVRKNNQDSGYAGPNFLLIADGMGGHAGGDVASAITVSQLEPLDHPDQGSDAMENLRSAILTANERITNTVATQHELAGMGTTVTALLRSGEQLALAHIGDSRAYLLRGGILTQITSDHTFVQMLVDEGRITPEEAETHPQRSVVMRVLGDVGQAPELDMSIREARPGDRWMLCSDGLTGFADIDEISTRMEQIDDPGACADALIDLALGGGGGDNVTVLIGDVVPADRAGLHTPGVAVGSVAINPQYARLGISGTPTGAIPEVDDASEDDTVGLPRANQPAPAALPDDASAAEPVPGFLASETPAATAAAETPAEDAAPAVAAAHDSADADAEAERAWRESGAQPATQPLAAAQRPDAGHDGGEPADSESAEDSQRAAARSAGSEDTGSKDAASEGRIPAWRLSGTEDESADQEPKHAKNSKHADSAGAEADAPTAREPKRRRGLVATITTLAVIVVLAAAGFLGWRYLQAQYYVTASDGRVAVYSGVSQNLGPFSLSNLSETTDVQTADLSDYSRERLDQTIPATSKQNADEIVTSLREEAQQNSQSGDTIKGGATDATANDPAPSQGGGDQ
ncbi:protein phosphatase 2C domain-containing protein [Brevibacterium sp. 50QC2O2]|uniref:PP2C family protein-serine/threonine phosphatase n=1 Tax=Brevibacterium sp. 50QC2O2 TaxID=2968459 RepID=UPI00211C557F|nr:protein phosphatase 2C domain-containing protein [Brevibacterium sp. 50QC2O2]